MDDVTEMNDAGVGDRLLGGIAMTLLRYLLSYVKDNLRTFKEIMQNRLTHKILLWSATLILTLAGWILATPVRAETLATAPTASAEEVFRNAYNGRYVWDSDFPGFSATVDVTQDGATYQGEMEIDSNLQITVVGIDDEDAYQSVYSGLQMLVTHRRAVPFDLLHKEHTFSFGPVQANGAVEIDQAGGATPSFYLVQDGKITQVNRLMPTGSVTVDLLESEVTPMGYLGTHYHAFFKTPDTGEVIAEADFEDTYEKVGNYYIPSRQFIRNIEAGEDTTVEMKLSNIQLLGAV